MIPAHRTRLLLLVLFPTIAIGQGKPADVSAICAGSWSPPFPIQRADGRPVYVERGVIAPIGNRTLAIGAPTFFWLRADSLGPAKAEVMDTTQIRWSFTRIGVLVDAAGRVEGVPRPDTAEGQRWLALLGSRDGKVSVAWQASDSPAPPDGGDPPATRIELASFNGKHWTAPDTIIRGRNVDIEALPAVRPSRVLDVVAAVARDDSSRQVVHVARRSNGKWSTGDWHGGWFGTHAEALPTVDGSTALVLIGSIKNVNGVYSMRGRWIGDSVTWSQPVVIDSIRGGYLPFSAARLGGDSIVVLRGRSMKGGDLGGTMMTALSVDGGRNWTQTPPLSVGTEIAPRTVVDTEGRLHVFFRGASLPGVFNSPGAIMHSMWHAGVWTTPVAVSTHDSFTEPAAGVAPGGHLMATWAEAEFSPLGIQPRSFASRWTAGCGH